MIDVESETSKRPLNEDFAELFRQNTARILELQTNAIQAFQRMPGLPFLGGSNTPQHLPDPSQQLAEFWKSGLDQMLTVMRQTNEIFCRAQTEMIETLGRQAKLLTDQMQTNLRALEQQSQQLVTQVREVTRTTAEKASETLQGSGSEERVRAKHGA